MTSSQRGDEPWPWRLRVVAGQLRWAGMGVVVGVLAGLSSAGFLEALGWATDTRVDHRWLVLLLPLAGLVVGRQALLLSGEGHQSI